MGSWKMNRISKSSTSLRAATIVAAVVGLSVAGALPALAAEEAPSVTVTPATDLVDGQQVTVTGAGFRPTEPLSVSQCGAVSGEIACGQSPARVVTDATGSVTTTLTVRSSFEGFSSAGKSLGTVDCRASTCSVGLAADVTRFAGAAIAFR